MNTFRRMLPSAITAREQRDAHRRALDDDICVHIFTSSSTVVGILRVVVTLRSKDVLGDDLLAINAMMYLASALLAYWGLRTRNHKRNHRLEYTADGIFIAGMVFTVINTGFITWAMTVG